MKEHNQSELSNFTEIANEGKVHILVAGDNWVKTAIEFALTCHFPSYIINPANRTRITVIVSDMESVDDFVFEYQELMDNSYWRVVDLSEAKPVITVHRPQYEGSREDFVDIEWEFVIGRLSNPIVQEKMRRWAADKRRQLIIALCYDDTEKNRSFAEKFRRRLPRRVEIEVRDINPEAEKARMEELLGLAKYLHYFYQFSYEMGRVPTELPEEEVTKAWEGLDETMKRSNLFNVMAIPMKMRILGHDRGNWDDYYALTAEEINRMTAAEHNRWSVERLIQGSRPCTDEERKEVKEDMHRRLNDPNYAIENPVSLKKRYKIDRKAHYDLSAFSELGVDETGLPVARYDSELTAAIPLIVKAYKDNQNRIGNGLG